MKPNKLPLWVAIAVSVTILGLLCAPFVIKRVHTSHQTAGGSTDARQESQPTQSERQSMRTPPPVMTPLPAVAFSTAPGRVLPPTFQGLTVESVSDLPNLKAAVSRHRQRPVTRIVFQHGTSAAYYAKAVTELRKSSYIMGEILDSTAMKSTSVNDYAARTREYVKRFQNNIDIYEIGNELNGEWVGPPEATNAKVLAAHRVVKNENAALRLRTAVTLNFWPSNDCFAHPWEDTLTFAKQLPEEVRKGTDYVFLSFYETACNPRATPTDEQFRKIFAELSQVFPSSMLGMGECGAQGVIDGLPADPTLAEKARIARRYYGLQPVLRAEFGRRYVGGYFWWYYSGDSVPFNRKDSMWPVLEELFNKNA